MKVRVQYGETRLVIPCGDKSDRVVRLIADINKRFQNYLGDSTARVKELWTQDNFFINPNDTIGDVIDDGQVLLALDYPTWLEANLKLLEKATHEVSCYDYAQYPVYSYWAKIGKHKHNKIYVELGYGQKILRLELFDADALETYGKSGKPLITRFEEKGGKCNLDAFVEACLVIVDGAVTGVELKVKATSDKRPEIAVVGISNDLVIGDILTMQTTALPKPSKVYVVPSPQSEGPSITEFAPENEEPSGIPKSDFELPKEIEATGSCGLNIVQKEPILADRGWYDKSEKGFYNTFYTNLCLFNPSSDVSAVITNVKSEYKKGDEWVTMSTTLGKKNGYYNFSMYGPKADEGFNVEPDERLHLCVGSAVFINAPSDERTRRAHSSLPNPLVIRITFTNKEGKVSEIVTEYNNKPLYLPTQESRSLKRDGQKQTLWLQADNAKADNRIFAEVYHVKKEDEDINRYEIYTYENNRNKWIDKDCLQRLVFEAEVAAKEAAGDNKGKEKEGSPVSLKGTYELPISDLTFGSEEEGSKVSGFALVDFDESYCYGLKLQLQTSTSSATSHLLFDW